MKNRSYTELSRYNTFESRFRYLKLDGRVGTETFGFDRYMNQKFYTSREWRLVRQKVIVRDNGCDLGIDGYEIHRGLYIHHMNVMRVEDLVDFNYDILDPEFLITCTHNTHNAIHYGDSQYIPRQMITRKQGDTKLW